MSWTLEEVYLSVVRKSTHAPKFTVGRKLYDEILLRTMMGGTPKVHDIATSLAEEYKNLSFSRPDLYGETYAGIEIKYHRKNVADENDIKEREVQRIVRGLDFLKALRNGGLEDLGKLDAAIYVRDQNCPFDKGNHNSNVLVTEFDKFEPYYWCTKKENAHCGAIGRSGYFVEFKPKFSLV